MELYHRITTAALLTLVVSCAYYIDHNPDLAVRIANEYSQEAFVHRDFRNAYEKLTREKLDSFTEESFEQMIRSMHPGDNFPSSVRPTGWEIVPGKSVVNVYLSGPILDRPTYYRVELLGDSAHSYKVIAMYRQDSPFETSNLYRSIE